MTLSGLFEENARSLLVYARALVADEGLAEDSVQQAFVGLARSGLEKAENPRAYLYGAVRNALLNLLRDEKRRERTWQEACREKTWAVFVEPSEKADRVEALNAALAELPPSEREVVLLKVWGELTLAEVATTLSIPEGTAATRYRTALTRLREKLSARGWP